MKKALVLALVALFVLSFTASVMAAPVSITGDFRLRSISEEVGGADSVTNVLSRIRLDLKSEIDENITFKARIRYEDKWSAAEAGSTETLQLDRAYLTFANGQNALTLGKQPLFLGQGALMDNNFQAIQYAVNGEKFGFAVIGGKDLVSPTDFAAVNINASLNDKTQLTAAYLKPEGDVYAAWAAGLNFAVNPKFNLGAEFVTNTEADDEETGFNVVATFGALEEKGDNLVTLAYQDLGAAAVNPDWTTCEEAGAKGFWVELDHRIAANTDISVIYADLEYADVLGGGDLTRTYIQMTTKF